MIDEREPKMYERERELSGLPKTNKEGKEK